ncbi:hypothetical protein [Nocardia sp. NPDC056100]|uniref:hypothetical protein n=1 Tax=Nocardia sp. NPDC056100 TaxID=3345712 RepID=UPI0035D99A96
MANEIPDGEQFRFLVEVAFTVTGRGTAIVGKRRPTECSDAHCACHSQRERGTLLDGDENRLDT